MLANYPSLYTTLSYHRVLKISYLSFLAQSSNIHPPRGSRRGSITCKLLSTRIFAQTTFQQQGFNYNKR